MIGNSYLQGLFEYADEDTSLNQLLELLTYKDTKFIDSLWNEPVDPDLKSFKSLTGKPSDLPE